MVCTSPKTAVLFGLSISAIPGKYFLSILNTSWDFLHASTVNKVDYLLTLRALCFNKPVNNNVNVHLYYDGLLQTLWRYQKENLEIMASGNLASPV